MVNVDYNLYDIVRKPVVTEKSEQLSETLRKYSFFVLKNSTKGSICEAIEKIYPSVKVKKINLMNIQGKSKGNRGGKRADRKKAIITLIEGHVIDLKNLEA